MKKKVSDFIAEFLAKKDIRVVFGIIGSGNAHIYDSISALGYTEIVCVHHEQAAVMAMGTYFRTSGRLSACLATTGAGSTNTITGVVSCWMDSVPGLIISGNENSKFTRSENPLRIWGIQGYDSSKMVSEVTKYSQRLMDPNAIAYELEKAYFLSLSGRPGPSWLDVPMNVQSAFVESDELLNISASIPASTDQQKMPQLLDSKEGVKATLDLLTTSKRPVFWLGHGIRLSGAVDKIKSVIEKIGAPTLVSWAGIDMIDSDHPLVFGRAGIYGQRHSNFVLQNADLVVAIGTRLAIPQVGYDLSELARAAKFAVVDIDPAEAIKHGERISVPICSDAKLFLTELDSSLSELDKRFKPLPSFVDWVKTCTHYRNEFPVIGPEHQDKDGFINSYAFMERLNHYFKSDQIVTTDMGTALLSGHQVLKFSGEQRLMTSTGLGEMGFGLPAAIGASFAREQGEVLCLNCDGGMMMNLQELQTIAHYRLPIKIFIFNNDGYLMIKHTQKALFKGRYSGTDKKSGVTCPDYKKVAATFGFPSYQIRTWDDVESIVPKVQAEKGPVICEVFMHPEQLLVPKLALAIQKDGTIVSPPLEDLSPFISRSKLREMMMIGLHPKSETINS